MKKIILISILLTSIIGFSQEVKEFDLTTINKKLILNEFIENHGYSFLNFDPNDPTNNNSEKPDWANENTLIVPISKDLSSQNYNQPLIIVNRAFIFNKAVLKSIKINDIKSITIRKKSDDLLETYGMYGQHGLIKVNIKKKKLRKLKREFGRKLGN